MLRSVFLVLLLLSAGTVAAQNNDFSYTYLQATYTEAEFDNLDSDGDGIGLSASFELTPNFHIFGGYSGLDAGADADASGWRAGIGLNTPLSNLMDIVVRLAYQTTEVTAPGIGDVDDDGLGFGVGVRVGANEWIELYGGMTYLDLDSGNETVFDAGFLLNLNNAFAVGISGSWDDDVSALSIDGRLYFD